MQVNYDSNSSRVNPDTSTAQQTENDLQVALAIRGLHSANRSDLHDGSNTLFTSTAPGTGSVPFAPVLKTHSLNELAEMLPQEQYEQGQRYLKGEGVPQDNALAFQCFCLAASTLASAQLSLGDMHASGMAPKSDDKKAVRWYQKAATKGNVDALAALGACHEQGRGVEKDCQKAAELYEKAAQQGHAGSKNKLFMLRLANAGTRDEIEAEPLAQVPEYADVQYSLGLRYAKKNADPESLKKAFECFQRAANQNHASAQCRLGYCYTNGTGTVPNQQKAFAWYEKAAKQGNLDAQFILGDCYDNGTGTAQDQKMALEWYKLAAEQGDAAAQFNLGDCYENGTGTAPDQLKAFEWYGKAAKQGHVSAQFSLGVYYAKGTRTAADQLKAFEWFEKAAEQGHASAQFNLGVRYAKGTGTAQDRQKAFEWYTKAAEQGHERAQSKIAGSTKPEKSGSIARKFNNFFQKGEKN
jgi:TPR repeat protein